MQRSGSRQRGGSRIGSTAAAVECRRQPATAVGRIVARIVARIVTRIVAIAVAVLVAAVAPVAAQPAPDIKADIALLIDVESGTTLFERNADKSFTPGNLTKLLTLAVVFDQIKDGKLTLETEFPISEHAWRTGGAPARLTTMFAPINSRVKIADLLQGVIVQAANDGAIALAEGIAGTEAEFAILMRKKAADLGLAHSAFPNPTGLPDPDQKTTARDTARLAQALIETHPDLYKGFTQSEFTFNKIRQLSRVPLANAGIGVDGLSGTTPRDTGNALVVSAVQGGQRLLLVLAGVKTERERNDEAKKALEWGFRNFETFTVYEAGEVIGEASVFGGARSSVDVAAQKPVRMLLQRNNRDKLTGRVQYKGPVRAPIEAGQPIGRLVVYRGDQAIHETPVFAKEDVPVGSVFQRAFDAAWEFTWTRIRRALKLK
jgi:D-alanyl-D-alanine carboxypeptidase (penicillin-binding protein 5/6)